MVVVVVVGIGVVVVVVAVGVVAVVAVVVAVVVVAAVVVAAAAAVAVSPCWISFSEDLEKRHYCLDLKKVVEVVPYVPYAGAPPMLAMSYQHTDTTQQIVMHDKIDEN